MHASLTRLQVCEASLTLAPDLSLEDCAFPRTNTKNTTVFQSSHPPMFLVPALTGLHELFRSATYFCRGKYLYICVTYPLLANLSILKQSNKAELKR